MLMLTSSDLISGLIHSARLCSTGYEPPRYALDDLFWFTKGCHQVRHIKATNHDAFFLQFDDHCELILSGVDRPFDWMQSNLRAGMIESGLGDFKVYPGFLEDIEQLLPKILRLPDISDMPLHLHGHSLGGSLATLLSIPLKQLSCEVEKITTFGAPRPGDADFSCFYKSLELNARTLQVRHSGGNLTPTSFFLRSNSIPLMSKANPNANSAVHLNLETSQTTLELRSCSWQNGQSESLINRIGHLIKDLKTTPRQAIEIYVRSLESFQEKVSDTVDKLQFDVLHV